MLQPKLMFAGDPHGDFKAIIRDALQHKPDVLITLGDHDLEKPFVKVLAPVLDAGIKVYWIPGNHDGDRDDWYNRLFQNISGLWNLHGRVVEIGGVRIAGLGGVFREKIWFPSKAAPQFRSRTELLQATPPKGHQGRWKAAGELEAGIPRKHRVSIFPDDFDKLSKLQADILVTHEAPSCHKHGFQVIDELAMKMGVTQILHGHHHFDYEDVLNNGIKVMGLGKSKTFILS